MRSPLGLPRTKRPTADSASRNSQPSCNFSFPLNTYLTWLLPLRSSSVPLQSLRLRRLVQIVRLASAHDGALERVADDFPHVPGYGEHRVEVHAAPEAHQVQHMHQVLGGDVACGTR